MLLSTAKQPKTMNISEIIIWYYSIITQILSVFSDEIVLETPLGYVKGFETWYVLMFFFSVKY